MTNPDPNAPGATDQCATCGHERRWHHPDVEPGRCTGGDLDCACGGHFVEIGPATRMARFAEAAQRFAGSIVTVRAAMTDAMRSFHELHAVMQSAGMLDEPSLCDGCDRTDHPVTASPDGRALLCPDCQVRLAAQEEPARTPALQQLAWWHREDCDKGCGGTCTDGAAAIANAVGIPVEAVTGPSPDGLPDHWRDAPPCIDIDTLPVCPLDGEPLLQTYATVNQPTLYRHADGTVHPDRSVDLRHVPTDLEVTVHIPPYNDSLPLAPNDSCATCFPRVCDPDRSECRRHIPTLPPDGAPVIPGWRQPPLSGDYQTIPYAPGRGPIRYPHKAARTQDDPQGPVPDTAHDNLQGGLVTPPPATEQAPPWRCEQCGSDRWLGWRAGPAHERHPRRAQCVPCGHVQDLPPGENP